MKLQTENLSDEAKFGEKNAATVLGGQHAEINLLGWRPLHPWMRAVSALLIAVLAVSGPASGATLKTLSVGTLDAAFSFDASNSGPAIALTLQPPSADWSLPGSLPSTQIGLLLTAGSLLASGGSLYSLKFNNLYSSGNSQSAGSQAPFDNLAVTVDPTKVPVLTLGGGGLTLQYGMQLAFAASDDAGASMGKVRLASSQSWNIGDLYNTTQGAFVAGYGTSVPLRVENQSSGDRKSLTISAVNSSSATDVIQISGALLDVGPGVDLAKGGNGNLTLGLLSAGSSSSATSYNFDGKITLNGGAVYLTDSVLRASNGSGPSVEFVALSGNSDPRLVVAGTNTISSFSDQDAIGVVTSALDPSSSQPGTLIFDAGSKDLLGVNSLFTDGQGSVALALVKKGSGVLELSRENNSFLGGFTLNAGTLLVSVGGGLDDLNNVIGPVGGGELTIDGGVAGATIMAGTGTLFNQVTLLSGTTSLTSPAKVFIRGVNGGEVLTLSGIVSLKSPAGDINPTVEVSVQTPLKLTESLQVGGTLMMSGGSSLTLGPAPASVAPWTLGSFILKDGTLNLNQNATGELSTVTGASNTKRRITTSTGSTVTRIDGDGPSTWAGDFAFNGSGNKLAILSGTSQDNVAVAVDGAVSVTLESGTLAFGNIQRATSASSASLKKTGSGLMLFQGGIGAGSLSLGILDIQEGPVRFSSSGSVTLAGTLKVGALSAPSVTVDPSLQLTVSGALSGSGFSKLGTGLLLFSGSNSLTGPVYIGAGSLGLLNGTSPVYVGTAGTGSADAPTLLLGSGATISSPIVAGSGATSAFNALLASTGTAGVATLSGGITLSAGSAGYTFGLQATTGGTLNLSGSWDTGSKLITIGSAQRAGTVKLSSVLSTSGGVTVNAGTLAVGVNNALSSTTPVSLVNGNLDLGNFNTTSGAFTQSGGSIYGTGSLTASSYAVQSGLSTATLAGSGSLTKTGLGTFTISGVSAYTGATTVNAGTLAAGTPASSSINVASGATYKLTLGANGSFNGSFVNNGTTTLSANSPVTLTLGGSAGSFSGSGTFQIGNNVTLKLGTTDLFAAGFSLTLDGGKLDINGKNQTLTTLSVLNGGSILSSVSTGSITTNSSISSSSYDSSKVTINIGRRTNQPAGNAQDAAAILALYAGSLGDLASGTSSASTFANIVTRSDSNGSTLFFDKAVVASGSVSAQVNAGSLYTLSISAPVKTPLFTAQSGVTVSLVNGGTFSSGTLQVADTLNLAGGVLEAGNVSAGTYNVQSGSISAVLGGFGRLTKTGPGTVVLRAANNYVGGTQVDGGILSLGASGSLPTNGDVTVNAGELALGTTSSQSRTVTLNGGLISGGNLSAQVYTLNAGTMSTGLSGSNANVTKLSAGTVILNGVASYTGTTLVTEGILRLGVDNAIQGALTVQGGQLALGATSQTVTYVNLNGGSITGGTLTAIASSAFNLSSGTITSRLAGGGQLALSSGAGTVTLDNVASYTGLTMVYDGRLQLGSAGSLPSDRDVKVSGGVLALGGKSQFLGTFTMDAGSVENGTLNANAYVVGGGTLNATIAGSGSLSVTGSPTLAAANPLFSGATGVAGNLRITNADALAKSTVTLNSGVLNFGTLSTVNFGALAGSQNLALTNASSAPVSLNVGGNNASTTYAGRLSGAGSFNKTGTGVFTLSSGSDHTGSTAVNAGSLLLSSNDALAFSSGLNVGTGAVAQFTATTGTATLAALSGSGSVQFGSSAKIGGNVSAGAISVAGLLDVEGITGSSITAGGLKAGLVSNGAVDVGNGLATLGTMSGGLLNAGTLLATTITGGTATVAGVGSAQMVSGGSVVFNGAAATIGTLNGGAVKITSGTLSLGGGSYAGVLSGGGSLVKVGSDTLRLSGANTFTGSTTVNAGSLIADTNNSLSSTSSLTLNAGATIQFAARTGVVNLPSLSGSGTARFSSDAVIGGSLLDGAVYADGRLTVDTINISGGTSPTVNAAGVSVANLGGGTVEAGASGAQVGNLTGGQLTLKGGSSSITNFTNGSVVLSSNAVLTASNGSFLGTLSGTGTFVKDGAATLSLNTLPAETIGIRVQQGTLTAGNLLSGNRAVNVQGGARLSLSLAGTGTYSGVLSGAGSTILNGSSLTLGPGGSLDGALSLATAGMTLDVSQAALNPFGINAKLLLSSGTLVVKGTQEIELNSITLAPSGSLTIQTDSAGAKIYYDTQPSFLNAETVTFAPGSIAGLNVVGGSVTFDVLSQGTLLSAGTYQAYAGRVQLRGGSLLNVPTLLLDPKTAQTTIRLAGGTFSQAIIAGGTSHQGTVSIDGQVRAANLQITPNTTVKLSQLGSLISTGSAGGAAPIQNAGILQLSATSALKSVANTISGGGTVEKVDAEAVELTGANTYSGLTRLTAGALQITNNLSLGTGTANSILFNGGVLKYAYAPTSDLSTRFASGGNAAIDTNGYAIAYGASLSGGGGLTKLGLGTLTLTGTNSFTNDIFVQQGTLQVGNGSTGSVTANANVAGGATLRFQRNGALEYNGILSGTGTVEQVGAGTLTLGGNNTFAGTLLLNDGVLVLGASNALGAGSISFGAGRLQFGTGIATDISSQIQSIASGKTASISTNGNDVSFAHALSGAGGLTKTGFGKLSLTGANTYTGATSVKGGSLAATAGALAATGSVTVEAASLAAVDLNPNAPLTVASSAQATISGVGSRIMALSNANTSPQSVQFTATSGTVAIGTLSGLGSTLFKSDVEIASGIASGSVQVSGKLSSDISGGYVQTAKLASSNLTGGAVTVSDTASIQFVSGGILSVDGPAVNIGTLNGGAIKVATGILTLAGGSSSGVISGSGSLVKAGSGVIRLGGSNTFSGSTLVEAGSLVAESNAALDKTSGLTVNSGAVVMFTSTSGTVSLAALAGTGRTTFASNAKITGAISSGTISATGRLTADTFNGGTISAGGLSVASMAGGSATVNQGGAAIGALSSGALTLNGGASSVSTLNGGSVTLVSNALLTASSGNFAGLISGTGTLAKDGASTLTLVQLPEETVSVRVQSGTLVAGNLLTGARSVNVQGGSLNLTLAGGSYSGVLSGAGSTLLGLSSNSHFSLSGNGSLDGLLTLSAGTLSVANVGSGAFGGNASLTLGAASQLVVGSSAQELELQSLVLQSGATLSGAGGKILYDAIPTYWDGSALRQIIDPNNVVLAGSLISTGPGTVVFEENSKQGAGTNVAAGTYEFIAGRVKLKDSSGAEVLLNAKQLLLSPRSETTTVKIKSNVTLSNQVVAGGTGMVSIEAFVDAPKFVIGSNIVATLAQSGSLSPGGSFVNSGTLQLSASNGSKQVGNPISGSGSLEKVGAGTVELTARSFYTGATRLTAGALKINNDSALGAGGANSIVFNGGTLQYGYAPTVDLSSRFASGGVASVDTNGYSLTYAANLPGSGGLMKLGGGVLTLTGVNTFTSALHVGEGTLQVGNGSAGSIDADAMVASGATLRFNRGSDFSYAGDLSGSGVVEQAGAGALVLGGANSAFSGTLALNNGVVVLGTSSALGAGSVAFGNGSLRYATGVRTDISGQILPIASGLNAAIDTNGNDVLFASAISGLGGVTKSGAGALTFSGANSYGGVTRLSGGSLRYSAAGLSSSGTVATVANTSVILSSLAGSGTYTGSVLGAGVLIKEGEGSVIVANSQFNTGGVTINSGSLVLGTSASARATIKGTVTLNAGATLDVVTGGFDSNAALSFKGGALRIGADTLTVKSLDLTAGTILFAGSLSEDATIYTSSQSGSGVVLPEQLTILNYIRNPDGSAAPLSGPLKGTVTSLPSTSELEITSNSTGKLVTLAMEGLTLDKFTAQSGVNMALTKSLEVRQDARFNGGTLSVSGTLIARNGSVVIGSTATGGSVAATIASGARVQSKGLTITGSSDVSVADPISLRDVGILQVGALSGGTLSDAARRNDATLTIGSGTGTLTLVSGQTLQGSGQIRGNITLSDGSTLSPGNSPGTLYVAGSLNLASGTVKIEVGGGLQDQIDAGSFAVSVGSPTFLIVDTSGTLSSGGTLLRIFVNASTLTAGSYSVQVARMSSSGVVAPSVMYQQTTGSTLEALGVTRLKFGNLSGLSSNARALANAADTLIINKNVTSDGLLELGTGISSVGAVPAQLAAANPAQYAELAGLSVQRNLTLHQGLMDHLDSLRGNLLNTPEGAYFAWTTGYGASHKQDADAGVGTAGFSGSTWGDLLGVEQRIGGLLLGMTGAMGRTSANFSATPGRITTDSWHGGLYGVLDISGLMVESGFFYGNTETTARRTIVGAGLASREGTVKISGKEWTANIGLARPFSASEKLTITPSVRLIAQGQNLDAGQESSLSGLEVAVSKQKGSSLLHQAGLELRQKLSLAGRDAAASLRMDWIHNYSAKGRDLSMALAGDPAASATYRGSDAGADAFRVGVSLETVLTKRTTLRLGADYQSQKGGASTRGTISLGYQF